MRVIERTGTTVWDQGAMYKLVSHSVLLYGRDILVVTGWMIKVLTTFHHQAARQITGMTEKRGAGGEWKYTVEVAMEYVELHPIGVYVKRW